MGRMGWIELQEINTGFDFTTDCPFWNGFWDSGGVLGRVGSDPDSASKTLKQYHQVLWSKPLPNGVTMPLVGYGTYLTSPRKTEHLVRTALEVGYRHIDTAQNYGNEHEVGLAVKHSGIVREDLTLNQQLIKLKPMFYGNRNGCISILWNKGLRMSRGLLSGKAWMIYSEIKH